MVTIAPAANRVAHRRHPPPRAGLPFGLAVAAIFLAIFGFGGTLSWAWAPACVLACLGLSVLAWQAAGASKPLVFSPLMVPMLGLAAVVVAQQVFHLTLDEGLTRTALLQLVGYGAIFGVACNVFRHRRNWQLGGKILAGLTIVLVLLALVQYGTSRFVIYGLRDASYSYPMGPFINGNDYATCMVLLLPVLAVVAHSQPHGRQPAGFRSVIQISLGLCCLVSVALTGGRGAAIALAAEGLLALLWTWRRGGLRGRSAGLFLLLVLAALWISGGVMLARFGLLISHDPDVVSRWQAAIASWHIFRQWPAWGCGLGAFPVAFPRFRLSDDGLSWPYAHNDYIQLLAETGWVGASAALGVLVLYGDLLRTRLRTLATSPQGRLRRAMALGTLGFLINAGFDFPFHIPGLAFLFFFMLGAVCAPLPVAGNGE